MTSPRPAEADRHTLALPAHFHHAVDGGHSASLAISSDGPRRTGHTRSGSLSYRATSKTAGSEQSVPSA
ncbi:hypothetical protein [Streptomyces sp. NPDC001410]|uniref:hypothetical protein n=1 Tax=Streptomyces sp. NPDC001410 TaxID=3364574 RepID=UPI00368E20B9